MSVVTKEMVWAAADEIDAQGENPTLKRVRDRLGRGSYTTISEHMTSWRTRKVAAATPAVDPAPERVLEVSKAAAQEIWSQAVLEAEARLDAARTELEAEKAKLENDRLEAVEFAEQLDAQLEETKRELEAQRQAAIELKAELTKERDGFAAKLEAHQEQLAAEREKSAALAGRLEATQAQLDALIDRLGTKAASTTTS